VTGDQRIRAAHKPFAATGVVIVAVEIRNAAIGPFPRSGDTGFIRCLHRSPDIHSAAAKT
jgi:hypothetical protein